MTFKTDNPRKAKIVTCDENGNDLYQETIVFNFNPSRYLIDVDNRFVPEETNRATASKLQFQGVGLEKLSISDSWFDTTETGEDVSIKVNKLRALMKPDVQVAGTKKPSPPYVKFVWGSFQFAGVITSMNREFLDFDRQGVPLLAKVSLTITQHKDLDDYPEQVMGSGAAAMRKVHTVTRGERIDTLTADWRRLAEYNDIDDPRQLRAGQTIVWS